ncbi:unnamed protein product [Sphenostylis stenocarpa]|uniref:Uncharacterized protein n=1 Tax=Sphenostylis stenocarpa TaxID=92480 RepID=A0AA86SIZ5_9FABA|nr:unnamed protein product [Sphenostylis stenocarpa]
MSATPEENDTHQGEKQEDCNTRCKTFKGILFAERIYEATKNGLNLLSEFASDNKSFSMGKIDQ